MSKSFRRISESLAMTDAVINKIFCKSHRKTTLYRCNKIHEAIESAFNQWTDQDLGKQMDRMARNLTALETGIDWLGGEGDAVPALSMCYVRLMDVYVALKDPRRRTAIDTVAKRVVWLMRDKDFDPGLNRHEEHAKGFAGSLLWEAVST